MNTENSNTNESNKFFYGFTDKLNLKNPNKNIAPTWNGGFEFPDGSYSILIVQDCFEYIIKKDETIADNPPVKNYVNKIKNRIAFKTKTGYKVELLSFETMKLLGSTKKDVDQDKDGENVSN